MSQAELAERIQVSRQTIHAIESGDVIPSTLIALRLAKVFGVSVEDVFAEQTDAQTNVAFAGASDLAPGDRVITTDIGGRRIAHPVRLELGQPIPTAQQVQIVSRRLDDDRVELAGYGHNQPASWTVVCGCDPSLGLLTSYATSASSEAQAYWKSGNNATAMQWLRQGAIHIAATHTAAHLAPHTAVDAQDLWRMEEPCYRIHLANAELGWVVKRGNPCGFADAHDLADGRIRLVNRPIGAGARKLLDERLQAFGVDPAAVSQYEWTVAGHAQVAMAVEAGAADVGIATASAAYTMDLDFIPIQEEACHLWILESNFNNPGVQRLLDYLASDVFRWDLAHFGPYDVTKTGEMNHIPSTR